MGNTLYSQKYGAVRGGAVRGGTGRGGTGRYGAGLVQSNNPQSNTEKCARDNLPSHPSTKEFTLGHPPTTKLAPEWIHLFSKLWLIFYRFFSSSW